MPRPDRKKHKDNSLRLDSTIAMTQHHSSPSSAAPMPPIIISLMMPFRGFFTAPV